MNEDAALDSVDRSERKMTDLLANPDEDLAPTLPPGMTLNVMGFPHEDAARDFGNCVRSHLQVVSGYINLNRLAGVTVSVDLNAGLASIDHGYDNPPVITFTNNEQMRCAAKSVRVLRYGVPHIHIVYDALFIAPLTAPGTEEYKTALHLLAHECGHVEEMMCRDVAFPGLVMQRGYPNHVEALLRGTADVCWEEYAVCRSTSVFGNRESLKNEYARNIDAVVLHSIIAAQASIARFRLNADIPTLLREAGGALCEPLRITSYLLGHLDGTNDDTTIEAVCPSLSASPFLPVLYMARDALRDIWDTYPRWKDHSVVFAPLRAAAVEAMRICAITFDPLQNGHTYVHVGTP